MTANLYKITKYLFVSAFLITSGVSCKKTPPADLAVKTIRAKFIPVSDTIAFDSTLVRAYQPYKDRVKEKVNEKLAYTPINLTREDGELQSTLGNIYVDICMQMAEPRFEKITGKRSTWPCLITEACVNPSQRETFSFPIFSNSCPLKTSSWLQNLTVSR